MLLIPLGNSFRLAFPLIDNSSTSLDNVNIFMQRDRTTQWTKLAQPELNINTGHYETDIEPLRINGAFYHFRLVATRDGKLIQGNYPFAIKVVDWQTRLTATQTLNPAPILAFSDESLRKEVERLSLQNQNLQEQNQNLLTQIDALRNQIDTLLGEGTSDSFIKIAVFDYNPRPEWLDLSNQPHSLLPGYLYLTEPGVISFRLDNEGEEGTSSWTAYIFTETKDLDEPYGITRFEPFRVSGGTISVIAPRTVEAKTALREDDDETEPTYTAIVKVKARHSFTADIFLTVQRQAHVYAIVCVRNV